VKSWFGGRQRCRWPQPVKEPRPSCIAHQRCVPHARHLHTMPACCCFCTPAPWAHNIEVNVQPRWVHLICGSLSPGRSAVQTCSHLPCTLMFESEVEGSGGERLSHLRMMQAVQHNGTLYVHALFVPSGVSMDLQDPEYDPSSFLIKSHRETLSPFVYSPLHASGCTPDALAPPFHPLDNLCCRFESPSNLLMLGVVHCP
jgi:hypothetical protein